MDGSENEIEKTNVAQEKDVLETIMPEIDGQEHVAQSNVAQERVAQEHVVRAGICFAITCYTRDYCNRK